MNRKAKESKGDVTKAGKVKENKYTLLKCLVKRRSRKLHPIAVPHKGNKREKVKGKGGSITNMCTAQFLKEILS